MIRDAYKNNTKTMISIFTLIAAATVLNFTIISGRSQVPGPVIPVTYQLFGPRGDVLTTPLPVQWGGIGSHATSFTKPFQFSLGYANIRSVAWRIVWRPAANGSSKAKLMYWWYDSTPALIGPFDLVQINGKANSGPTWQTVTSGPPYLNSVQDPAFGAAFQQFVNDRRDWHIAVLWQGDGVTPVDISETSIMIEWQL